MPTWASRLAKPVRAPFPVGQGTCVLPVVLEGEQSVGHGTRVMEAARNLNRALDDRRLNLVPVETRGMRGRVEWASIDSGRGTGLPVGRVRTDARKAVVVDGEGLACTGVGSAAARVGSWHCALASVRPEAARSSQTNGLSFTTMSGGSAPGPCPLGRSLRLVRRWEHNHSHLSTSRAVGAATSRCSSPSAATSRLWPVHAPRTVTHHDGHVPPTLRTSAPNGQKKAQYCIGGLLRSLRLLLPAQYRPVRAVRKQLALNTSREQSGSKQGKQP